MEDYQFLEKLGDGAQGVVYRVRHHPTQKEYAMKVIRCIDQSQVNNALKEIKVLLQLRHKHIVLYTDFFLLFHTEKTKSEFLQTKALSQSVPSLRLCSTEGMDSSAAKASGCGDSTELAVCLVMELCTNGDMTNAICDAKERFMETGTHPIEEAQMLTWLEQCSSALQYTHEKGFMHRDIKPTNVFFDSRKDVKLGDFGLAVSAGIGRQSVVGTPYYLSPERMLEQTYDDKVDVWGLGIVMLELVTLQERPLNSQILENPLVVESILADVTAMGFSSKLAVLLRDMLQRYPEGRPSPVVINRRIAGMMVGSPRSSVSTTQLNGLSDPKTPPAVCDLCEVETAIMTCPSCSASYCEICDVARHKHHSRKSHVRVSLLNGSRVFNTTGSTAATPTTFDDGSLVTGQSQTFDDKTNRYPPQQDKFKIVGQSQLSGRSAKNATSMTTTTTLGASVCSATVSAMVSVPGDYPTLEKALAAVHSLPYVRRIVVAGGSMFSEPIVLNERLPDGIDIVGLSPAPVLEVSESRVTVDIRGGRGTLQNFVIRQASRETPQEKRLPLAVRITGGEWKLLGCRVSCNGGSGICVGAGVAPVVRDCTVIDVKQAGIHVLAMGGGTFERNRIASCEYAGILLKRNSTALVHKNVIQDGKETGIFCHNCGGSVEENEISNNGGCGIVIKGPECSPIVRRNHITGNAQAGFFCCESSTPIIMNNNVEMNNKAGVLIKTLASPKLTHNIVRNNKEAGIYVFESGSGTIEDNEILDNFNAGILVTTSGNPHVLHNVVRRNSYEGVWVCKGGSGTFSQNDVRHNNKGPKDIESGCVVAWLDNKEC